MDNLYVQYQNFASYKYTNNHLLTSTKGFKNLTVF